MEKVLRSFISSGSAKDQLYSNVTILVAPYRMLLV